MASGDSNIDYPKLRRLVGDFLTRTGTSDRALSLRSSDGRNSDLVRNLMKGTDSSFPSVVGLCRAMDIPVGEVLLVTVVETVREQEWLTVLGDVEAGVWREQAEWSHDDWYQVEVDDSDYPVRQSGLVVRGRSMDRTLPPGTILRCVDLISAAADWQDGDYVIVERSDAGRVELTCKRLSRTANGWELIAESTLPEFRDPIFIGKPVDMDGQPGFDALIDTETRVKALVIDALLPLRRRRRRPMPESEWGGD